MISFNNFYVILICHLIRVMGTSWLQLLNTGQKNMQTKESSVHLHFSEKRTTMMTKALECVVMPKRNEELKTTSETHL